MKKKMVSLAMTALTATTLLGCAAATGRVNRRAESHVKYHAAKQLDCEEKSLQATCTNEYRSGECYQFEIVGCNTRVVYRNISGSGWTSGS